MVVGWILVTLRALTNSQNCTSAAGSGTKGRAISVAMARDGDAEVDTDARWRSSQHAVHGLITVD